MIPGPDELQARLRQLTHRGLLHAYDRVIIDLHIRDGLSFREVARRLGRHPGTISRQWYGKIVPMLRGDHPRVKPSGDDDAA